MRRAFLLLLVLASCRRHEAPAEPAAPPVSALPADRLAPGELIPGDKKAFGIVLPRDLHVDQSLPSLFYASGPVNASDLANYVRARVKGGDVSVGAAATVFDGVTVDSDADAGRILVVRVFPGPMGRGAHIEVRDVTPPPVPQASSTAERWRRMGLTPEGRVLDPTQLH